MFNKFNLSENETLKKSQHVECRRILLQGDHKYMAVFILLDLAQGSYENKL